MCRRIAGTDADADDAAQEAMIRIVRGARPLRRPVVVRHLGLPHRHQHRARRAPQATPAAACCTSSATTATVAARPPTSSPSASVEAVVDRLALDAALADLPDDFRAAVVLRDVADLDYAEIAEVLDVPIGTVKSRIARGRVAARRPSREPRHPRRTSNTRTPRSTRPSTTTP